LPGVAGYWSLKDVVAHITWYEHILLVMLEHPASPEHGWLSIELETRNRMIYEQNRDRSFEEVLAEAADVFARILKAVEHLSEAELQQVGYFQASQNPPWKAVIWDTYEHYHQHDGDIRRWIETAAGVR
jgi:hypothetical protein